MPASNLDPQQDTKTRIIEAARDLYFEEGLNALTMRKVAKYAGMSTMAAYRHFENKDDLLGHVIIEGFRIFQQYFSRALSGDTPAARLQLSANAYLDFAIENPKYYEIMFMSIAHVTDTPPSQRGQALVKSSVQFLHERITECVEAGVLTGPPSKRKVLHLWSHSHGLISLYLSGHIEGSTPFRALYTESMEVMFAGLGYTP